MNKKVAIAITVIGLAMVGTLAYYSRDDDPMMKLTDQRIMRDLGDYYPMMDYYDNQSSPKYIFFHVDSWSYGQGTVIWEKNQVVDYVTSHVPQAIPVDIMTSIKLDQINRIQHHYQNGRLYAEYGSAWFAYPRNTGGID